MSIWSWVARRWRHSLSVAGSLGWREWATVALFLATVPLIIYMVKLVADAAFDKDTSLVGVGILAMVGMTVMAAALFTTYAIDDVVAPNARPRASGFANHINIKAAAFTLLAANTAFGAMALVMSLMEPSLTGTLSTTGKIVERIAAQSEVIEGKIDELKPKLPPVPIIGQKINGLWGSDNCSITFDISRQANAVRVKSVKRPLGTPAYERIFTIVHEQGNAMDTKGETGKERGAAGSFTYETNGLTERLLWRDDMMQPEPTVLDRCKD